MSKSGTRLIKLEGGPFHKNKAKFTFSDGKSLTFTSGGQTGYYLITTGGGGTGEFARWIEVK